MAADPLKPVRWIRSSLTDLKSFPEQVRSDVGFALYAAQNGEMDPSAKPMKGFGGAGVMEIVASFFGDTWRAIYTVRFQGVIYGSTLSRRNPNQGEPRRRRSWS